MSSCRATNAKALVLDRFAEFLLADESVRRSHERLARIRAEFEDAVTALADTRGMGSAKEWKAAEDGEREAIVTWLESLVDSPGTPRGFAESIRNGRHRAHENTMAPKPTQRQSNGQTKRKE